MEKQFNPREWLETAAPPMTVPVEREPLAPATDEQRAEIEQIIAEIESLKVDIAPEYKHWRNIGFAFADAFGEEGRKLFQRVSRFYPGYTESECNEQYDKCLKSNRGGVTLKTLLLAGQERRHRNCTRPGRNGGARDPDAYLSLSGK